MAAFSRSLAHTSNPAGTCWMAGKVRHHGCARVWPGPLRPETCAASSPDAIREYLSNRGRGVPLAFSIFGYDFTAQPGWALPYSPHRLRSASLLRCSMRNVRMGNLSCVALLAPLRLLCSLCWCARCTSQKTQQHAVWKPPYIAHQSRAEKTNKNSKDETRRMGCKLRNLQLRRTITPYTQQTQPGTSVLWYLGILLFPAHLRSTQY